MEKLRAGMLVLTDGWGLSSDGTDVPTNGAVLTATKFRMRYQGVDKLLFDSEAGVFQFDSSVVIGSISGSQMQSDISDASSAAAQAASDAAAASSAAAAARASADAALGSLTEWTSDNILSPVEKPGVILQYDTIIGEQSGIQSQADAYGVSRTGYDNAVSALTTYLNGLTTPVAWNDLSGNTTIVGITFRARFQAVYAARQALLNAIYATAKSLADTAQSTADSAYNLADSAIQTGGFVSVNAQKQIIALSTQGITISTATSGARVEMNSTGVGCYDVYGVLKTFMDARGFHCRRGWSALPQDVEMVSFETSDGYLNGFVASHLNANGGLIVAGRLGPLLLYGGLYYDYGASDWTWDSSYGIDMLAGGRILMMPGVGIGGYGDKTVSVGRAANPDRVLQVWSTIQMGSGPTITYGAGAPSGPQPVGSLYLGTGGSLWFYQVNGWRRIDNWTS